MPAPSIYTLIKYFNLFLIVAAIPISGALLVVGYLNWIHWSSQQNDDWIEIQSQILNACFTYLVVIVEGRRRVLAYYHLQRLPPSDSNIAVADEEGLESAMGETVLEARAHQGVSAASDSLAKLRALYPEMKSYPFNSPGFKLILAIGAVHIVAQIGMAVQMWAFNSKVRSGGGVAGCFSVACLSGTVAGLLPLWFNRKPKK
ncbi:hypothetical protein HDU78_008890 [Chytriomyces hyalinus]|nr:hypothetical protein HDU78_008890 [Chytriomyces hyalinus]